MRVIFDIDGVVRDLVSVLEQRYEFTVHHWNFMHDGKDFWDMAKEIPDLFVNAPPTKYYSIIKQCKCPTFWTIQKPEYRNPTITWLDNRFDKYKIRFFRDFEHKQAEVYKKNVLLFDDFPNFTDYSKIMLIDTNYNKKTKAKVRIKTPEQLQKILDINS
jgi:hypothetical protein